MAASLEAVVNSVIGRDHSSEVLSIDKFLGDDAIRLLSKKLTGNKLKRRVVLRGNCIGTTGAEALSALLKDNGVITFLSLEWNQIGSEGTSMLAGALATNTGLIHLDLRNNGIGDDGAVALVEALMKNDTIKTIDLRWNQIGDKGALAFKEVLLDRTPAVFVQLKGNPLSAAVEAQIDGWMQGLGTDENNEVEAGNMGNLNRSADMSDAQLQNMTHATVQNSYQSAVLQKEAAQLRQQCVKLQGSCADLQRQLDSSAIKVTEMEQTCLRHEFRVSQLTEAYKEASGRLANVMEEHKAQAAAWDLERKDILAELKSTVKEKEAEIMVLRNERDSLRDRIKKTELEVDRVSTQSTMVLEQSRTDREQAQDELRQANTKIAELTAVANKLEAENSVVQGKTTRAAERLAAAEQQLEATRTQAEANLQSEMASHAQELDGVRSDYSAQLAAAAAKVSAQMREISELHTKVASAEASQTRERIDMERKADEAVVAAREGEKTKAEQTINDLRQRLQAFLATRTELEARCENYLKEIKTLEADGLSQTSDMQKHAVTLEAELQRVRTQNASLKDSLSAVETQAKLSARELSEVRAHARDVEEKAEETRREAKEAIAEQHRLREKSASLEAQLANAIEARTIEYNTVKQSAMRALDNEFETLRLAMRIKLSSSAEK